MEDTALMMKGKRKLEDLSCGAGVLRPPINCLVKLDFEESDFPIWRNAVERRGDYYQHLRDAPKMLEDLKVWLKKVEEFERRTKLKCPNYKDVRAMVGPDWVGRWTLKALLAFQAVANSSGIMHPPCKVSVFPSWCSHAAIARRTVMKTQLRHGVTRVKLPPSADGTKCAAGLEGSLADIPLSKADPPPPSTLAARAIPNQRNYK